MGKLTIRRVAAWAGIGIGGLTLSWLSAAVSVYLSYNQMGARVRWVRDTQSGMAWLWAAPEKWPVPERASITADRGPWGCTFGESRWAEDHFVKMANGSIRTAPAQYEIRSGWPINGWRVRIDYDRVETIRTIRILGLNTGIPSAALVKVPGSSGRPAGLEWLPVEPAGWRGLASLAFWTGVVLVIARGPGFVRRRYRRVRGCCESCGYSAVGISRCPECGEVITPKGWKRTD